MPNERFHSRLRSNKDQGPVNRSLSSPRPAIFLDRDGTLNLEVDYLHSPGQLELLPGVASAIRRINLSGYLAIVITNQAVIARGDCTEAELDRIHDKLEALLKKEGAYLDAIYYCPHRPTCDSPRARSEFILECECRKPGIGMIERAKGDFEIDLASSWLIGDTTTDLQTAHNAGLRSVLVRTGYAGEDGRWPAKPDFEFSDLSEAVESLLSRSE